MRMDLKDPELNFRKWIAEKHHDDLINVYNEDPSRVQPEIKIYLEEYIGNRSYLEQSIKDYLSFIYDHEYQILGRFLRNIRKYYYEDTPDKAYTWPILSDDLADSLKNISNRYMERVIGIEDIAPPLPPKYSRLKKLMKDQVYMEKRIAEKLDLTQFGNIFLDGKEKEWKSTVRKEILNQWKIEGKTPGPFYYAYGLKTILDMLWINEKYRYIPKFWEWAQTINNHGIPHALPLPDENFDKWRTRLAALLSNWIKDQKISDENVSENAYYNGVKLSISKNRYEIDQRTIYRVNNYPHKPSPIYPGIGWIIILTIIVLIIFYFALTDGIVKYILMGVPILINIAICVYVYIKKKKRWNQYQETLKAEQKAK
jgi:hypothetical protein